MSIAALRLRLARMNRRWPLTWLGDLVGAGGIMFAVAVLTALAHALSP